LVKRLFMPAHAGFFYFRKFLQNDKMMHNDVQAIIAFLEALNDESFDQQIPTNVPSGLPVGGNIQ